MSRRGDIPGEEILSKDLHSNYLPEKIVSPIVGLRVHRGVMLCIHLQHSQLALQTFESGLS